MTFKKIHISLLLFDFVQSFSVVIGVIFFLIRVVGFLYNFMPISAQCYIIILRCLFWHRNF